MNRIRPILHLTALLLSGAALSACASVSSYETGTTRNGNLSAATINDSLDEARSLRASGDNAGALKILSQLLLAAPDNARVVGEYGKALAAQGRAKEAIDFLTRAAALAPSDWALRSALGVAYDEAGEKDKAAAAYEAALMLKPGEPSVLNNYALSRAMAGDAGKAKQLIEQAVRGSDDARIKGNHAMILKLAANLPPAVQAVAAPQAAPTPQVKAQTLPSPVAMASAKPQSKPAAKPRAVAAKPPAEEKTKTTKSGDIPSLRLTADTQ